MISCITQHLLPLPKGQVSDVASASSDTAPDSLRKTPKPKKKAKASSAAKAKCSDELKFFKQFDKNGLPLCCKEAVNNGRCKKSSHVCMKCN